ncbi:MAG: Nickel/cobalt transporter regulator [Ramlibacter sp.]|jgi:Ni/Co efflux regulator RcnB|nr:Nickel/cobalt transporter regulator [Ramlibacter sp.]
MNTNRSAFVLGAACLLFGALSHAQGTNEAPGPNISREAEMRGDIRRDSLGNIYEIRRDAYGNPVEMVPADPNYPRKYYDDSGRLYSGGYLPRFYEDPGRVVRNWRRQHLDAPRRGEHWVRIDNGNYALIDRDGRIVRMESRRR